MVNKNVSYNTEVMDHLLENSIFCQSNYFCQSHIMKCKIKMKHKQSKCVVYFFTFLSLPAFLTFPNSSFQQQQQLRRVQQRV